MTNAEGDSASRATVRPQPEVEIGNSFRLRPERPAGFAAITQSADWGHGFGTYPHFRCRLLGPAYKSEANARPRMNSTQPITTTWQTNSQACQRTTPEFPRRCRDLDRLCRVILVVRLSQHRLNLVRLRSIPSSSALIRRLKQHAPARYSPTPLPVHCPVRRRPTRRLQAERLHPTTRLLRMVRIANLRSSMPPSIDEPLVPTDW